MMTWAAVDLAAMIWCLFVRDRNGGSTVEEEKAQTAMIWCLYVMD